MSEPVPEGLREADGSTPVEDDALLRQPGDEAAEDRDTERPARPDQPAEGPDDEAYTGH